MMFVKCFRLWYIYDGDYMNIVYANTFKQRFIGLMFKRNIDFIMVFDNCNAIHTFFMKVKIDVYMVDENGFVLFIFRNIERNRIIWPKKNVTKVFETAAGLWNYDVGDFIKH